ncbi:hypothetical protein C9J85_03130 [Haloferax sp. wsp5]|nr:hypothetical protein C9J85_03130 [Haloferax sp. wsp5]
MMDKLKQIQRAKAELENPRESDHIRVNRRAADLPQAQRRAVIKNGRIELTVDGRTSLDSRSESTPSSSGRRTTPGGPSLARRG